MCPNGDVTYTVINEDNTGCTWKKCSEKCKSDVIICAHTEKILHRDIKNNCAFPSCDPETDSVERPDSVRAPLCFCRRRKFISRRTKKVAKMIYFLVQMEHG